jgi:hypothetical protein
MCLIGWFIHLRWQGVYSWNRIHTQVKVTLAKKAFSIRRFLSVSASASISSCLQPQLVQMSILRKPLCGYLYPHLSLLTMTNPVSRGDWHERKPRV